MAQSVVTTHMEENMDEADLLIFTKEEEEFMVVPTLEDLNIMLEDLLSEDNFNVLTVDALQNPSAAFVVDVDRTSGNHDSVKSNALDYTSDVQFQNSFSSEEWHSQSFGQQFTSGISNQFSSANQISNGHVHEQPALSAVANTHQQFDQLTADPTANWVTETTDVSLLEQFVCESGQLDDILDFVPQEQPIQTSVSPSSLPTYGSHILDKDRILEEIYREAAEISSRRESPASSVDQSRVSTSSVSLSTDGSESDDDTMDSYMESVTSESNSPLINTKRKGGRKNSVTEVSTTKPKKKKERAPNREVAKQKKRYQNREAALRYRLKKRSERSAIGEELGGLMQRNEQLKSEKSKLASEIAYLHGLLAEVQKAKMIRS